MKNNKYFFIGLLLSASMSGAVSSNTNCSPNFNCSSTSDNCNVSANISASCSSGCSFSTATTSYCGSYASTNCEYTNYRPGYILRPFTADNTLELAVFDYDVYHRAERGEDRPMVDFQATYFHRGSRSKTTGAGLYLGKNSFSVKQDGTGDINSAWLNLLNSEGDYSSTFSYNPKYKVDGAYLGARFDLSDWACGLWGSASSAFVRIKNTVKICTDGNIADVNCNDCCTASNTVQETLGNRLGLTNNASNGQMFIDDVQFKLGYDHYIGEDNHIGLYLVGTAPTRRSQTNYTNDGELAFAHLISGRGSFGVGLNTDWTAWACNDHSLNWLMDLKYRYVFRGFEKRHFDLKNGALSGYVLQGVTSDAVLNGSGSLLQNALLLPVKVTPGSTIDLWTALHYQFCNYGIEFGYDLFWIGQEKVTLRQNLQSGIGIFDFNGLKTGAVAVSDSANAVITGVAAHASDASFTALTNANLAFASATTKRAISHKFYLALSHEKDYFCGPVNMSVGGEYEYASKSQPIISQWGLFIKSSMNY